MCILEPIARIYLLFFVRMMQLIGSVAIQGLSGQRVDVEVDIATGIPAFSIVGL